MENTKTHTFIELPAPYFYISLSVGRLHKQVRDCLHSGLTPRSQVPSSCLVAG